MSMKRRILKWKRDRAVTRLTRNGYKLYTARQNLMVYCEAVPFEERDQYHLTSMMMEIERLRQKIEDDKNFIRTTA